MLAIEQGRADEIEDVFDGPCLNILRPEGEMTEIKKKLVQTDFLARAIETLGLENYLLMGKGDIKGEVQKEAHVKEDLFEAILGAVALDSDWNLTILESVVDRMLKPDYYIENGFGDELDYITWVNNWHQKEYGTEPTYRFSESFGGFECCLGLKYYPDAFFRSEDKSKARAQSAVAKKAYEYISQMQKKESDVIKSVGEITLENAINKLQELWQKGFVGKPEYAFSSADSYILEGEGAPRPTIVWICDCFIDGERCGVGYSADDGKKVDAKKEAALQAIQHLWGRDTHTVTIDEFRPDDV